MVAKGGERGRRKGVRGAVSYRAPSLLLYVNTPTGASSSVDVGALELYNTIGSVSAVLLSFR